MLSPVYLILSGYSYCCDILCINLWVNSCSPFSILQETNSVGLSANVLLRSISCCFSVDSKSALFNIITELISINSFI